MGYSQDRVFSEDAVLREKYESYCMCRAQQFVHFRRPDQGGKERLVSVIFTTGFSILPREGGLEDQDYITVRLFAAFLRGEREGQIRMMQR